MNIGISTACFYPDTPENAIDIVGKLGFKHIELFVNTEYEYNSNYADFLKEKLEYYGIDVVSIHSYTAALEGLLFFSDYSRRTDDALLQYSRYFDFSEFLGAKFFTFHGERNGLMNFTDGKALRDIETYKNLSSLANNRNLFLAQENVAYCKSADIPFLETLYKNVPNLRYTLDVKQAFRSSTSVFDYIDVMRDRLANIHANDYDNQNSCKLPLTGDLNFNEFLKRLNHFNYNGDLLIEVYRNNFKNPSELSDCKSFLQKTLNI